MGRIPSPTPSPTPSPSSPTTSSLSHSSTPATVTVLAGESAVEDLAVVQLRACAALPGVCAAVGLPDLHPGGRFPVGAAVASKGWIHPPLIGGDVGCGMSWYRVSGLRAQALDRGGAKRVSEALRGLEGPWRDAEARRAWLDAGSEGDKTEKHGEGEEEESEGKGKASASAGEKWDKALGTIGAGNHFAELQIVEHLDASSSASAGVQAGDVVLLVHSGSRGFGKSVLERFCPPGVGGDAISLRADSEEAAEYLQLHDQACAWAQANRDLIAYRFLSLLEPGGEWDEVDRAHVQSRCFVNIHHNNLTRAPWPSSNTSNTNDTEVEEVFLHRKGAAPCIAADTPLLPLPGSRGTATLFLKPAAPSETNAFGALNAFSAAHGAGRALSRAKALATLKHKYAPPRKHGRGGCSARRGACSHFDGEKKAHEGAKEKEKELPCVVVCEDGDMLCEEAPEAYKDVECIGRDLEARGVATVVGLARPRVTYKMRKEER